MKHRREIENSLKLTMASRLIREVFVSLNLSVPEMNQVLTPLSKMRQGIQEKLRKEVLLPKSLEVPCYDINPDKKETKES